jgi:CubicO group peptidase (beta-lactamase class C family)
MNKRNIVSILFIFITVKICNAQNIDQSKLKNLQQIAQNFLAKEKIPGMSLSISQKNKIIFSEGFGFSNLKKKAKVYPKKTKFRIASISKTLTSFALGKLIDKNLLSLDSSLYKYVPSFPRKKYDFTVRQLAGHTSGIRHYNGTEFLLNRKMSIKKGLDIFKKSKLLFEPQTKYNYSTYGWNLLSVVIQNASKLDYFDFMKDSVFTPLKMKNTLIENKRKSIKNLTQFYIKRNNTIKKGPLVNNYFKAAGGGFLSTSEDLIRFGNQYIKPTLISENTLNEFTSPQILTNGKSTKYGVGIVISKTKKNILRLAHSGGGVGASAYLIIYPEKEIVISLLTNLSGVNMNNFIKNLEKELLN